MNALSDVLIPAVIFLAFYHMFRILFDFLLKRKLIKAGQYEKVSILEAPKSSEEIDRYPSLKWGLVALTTGLGFILIDVLKGINPDIIDYRDAVLPIGILLVFVSLGFLIYFFIMNSRKK